MAFRDNRIFYLTRALWRFSEGNRKQVIAYVIMSVLSKFVNIAEPLVIAKIINDIQRQGLSNLNLQSTILWLSLILVLNLGFWALHGPSRVMEKRNAFLVRANFKRYLLEGTMALPPAWHADHHSGDTIDRIEKATSGLYEFANRTFTVISLVVTFAAAYAALIFFNIHASYIVLAMLLAIVFITVRFDSTLGEQYRQLNEVENTIAARIYDSISNITTIVILRVENLITSSIWKKIMSPFRLYMKNRTIDETKWWLVSFSSALMMFFVLLSYILSAVWNQSTVMIGTLFVLYTYLDRITDLFFNFTMRWGEYLRYKMQVANAEPLMKEFTARQKVKPLTIKGWKQIEIRNLNFSYHDDQTDLHLTDINMTISRSQRIALVGESGSGKTTILKVMRELYSAHKGQVYLDGKKVKGRFKALAPHITLIPQDPEIFNSTIKENITLGLPTSMSKLREYTDMARFTKVVERLPKGFDSSIMEKGVNLSGGEKQRLALARGLMACKNKQIILLDEPTSSVDPTNELKIYRNIFERFNDRTIISSIHRLHLLPMFDMIFYFDKGRIIASGTLEELKKDKHFRKVWREYNKKARA